MTSLQAQAAALQAFLTTLSDDRHATYSYTAALTFLAYDIVLSFGEEVKYIWGSKWSTMKVLYFMVRYFAIINLIPIIALFTHTAATLSNTVCQNYFRWSLTICGPAVLYLLIHWILLVRVWALYGRSKSLLIVLIVLVLANFIAGFAPGIVYMKTVAANVRSVPAPWRGCASTVPKNGNYMLVAYIPNNLLAILFLGMTFWKLVQNQHIYGKPLSWGYLGNIKAFTPLLLACVRDGIVYFILAFIIAFFGLISALWVHGVLASVFFPWNFAVLSYSGAHLILNLRALGGTTENQTWNDTMSYHHGPDGMQSRPHKIVFAA